MRKLFLILILCYFFSACEKVLIPVTDNTNDTDLNISYFDNYQIDLSTYKADSFLTSGTTTFNIGYHKDSLFGTIQSGAYAQIELPGNNPIRDKNVSFDSLVLVLKPTTEYYGDTLLPFKIEAHRLLQKIENDDGNDYNFYNTRKFLYEPALLGAHTAIIRPKRGASIVIRLPDLLGRELLIKLKNNNSDIQDNGNFTNYFKGVYLGTDTLFSKTMYYFTTDTSTSFMRLHYHLNGALAEEKILDFPLSTAKQFNNVQYSHRGTDLSAFTPYKKQLKKSNLTGNKVYLHTNMASSIKISFPSILKLKELYPYVKVMKAELVIKPSPATYRYPYQLPNELYLYYTDDNNNLNSQVVDNFGQFLNGNLYIDKLYGDNTNYSFEITNYINSLLNEGRFSTSALMLVPSATSPSTQLQRLLINDQSKGKDIQLKLYLLGL